MSADPDVARAPCPRAGRRSSSRGRTANDFVADPPTDLTWTQHRRVSRLRPSLPMAKCRRQVAPRDHAHREPSCSTSVHRRADGRWRNTIDDPSSPSSTPTISAHPWLGNGVGPESFWQLPDRGHGRTVAAPMLSRRAIRPIQERRSRPEGPRSRHVHRGHRAPDRAGGEDPVAAGDEQHRARPKHSTSWPPSTGCSGRVRHARKAATTRSCSSTSSTVVRLVSR